MGGYGGGYYFGYYFYDMNYQFKVNYYSDYRFSQFYLVDFCSMDYFSQFIINFNYMKSIIF